jgi:nucleotide-binding universal stress UspA family protein
MTVVVIIVVVLVAAGAAGTCLVRRGVSLPQRATHLPGDSGQRILFPFVATALSRRALDAALRLARAEEATLVPVFLARVPMHLPMDAPLPRQAGVALPLQEAIEHRARRFGVPVDARIERGRTHRHALRETIQNERFDRIVVAASPHDGHGFHTEDVAWLLDHAPGEIVVVRPGTEDQIEPRREQPRPRRALAGVAGS